MTTFTTHPRFNWEMGIDPPKGLRMTEEEFEAWCDPGLRAEWVDGEVIIMAPVNSEHDHLGWWLRTLLAFYVERRGLGLVRGPEFTARFAQRRRRRVPDVMFATAARQHLLKPTYFDGAPDMIIEVVSPESESRDWRDKYLDYEAAGVREYWIIEPMSQNLEAYSLGPDSRYALIAPIEDRIPSSVIPGWYLKPSWLFAEKRPSVLDILPELGIK